jgi:hypothetical protein
MCNRGRPTTGGRATEFFPLGINKNANWKTQNISFLSSVFFAGSNVFHGIIKTIIYFNQFHMPGLGKSLTYQNY